MCIYLSRNNLTRYVLVPVFEVVSTNGLFQIYPWALIESCTEFRSHSHAEIHSMLKSELFFFLILIPSKNGQLPLEDTVLNLTCLRPSCQYRIFFTQSQARKPCVQSLDIWHLFIRNYFGLIDNHRHCKKPLSGCYKNCPYISPICVSSSSLTENFCGFSLSRSNGA